MPDSFQSKGQCGRKYPKLIRDASEEEEKTVEGAFSQSRDVESRHADLYKKAMNDMLPDRQSKYCVCQVCGYISENEASESCPICGVDKGRFKVVN